MARGKKSHSRVQIFPTKKPEKYKAPEELLLGRYNPTLGGKIIVINPKTKKKYELQGEVTVDTGASGLSIDNANFDRMEKKLGPIKKRAGYSGTAAGHSPVWVTDQLAYCVKDKCVKATIASNEGGYILLGMDFLDDADCVLNLKNRKMKCGDLDFDLDSPKALKHSSKRRKKRRR